MEVTVQKSNMLTKNYCTECGSFDLIKLHRSYLGRSLNVANKLQCNSCNTVISPKAFLANDLRDVPLIRETLQINVSEVSEVVDSSLETVVIERQEAPRERYPLAEENLIVNKERNGAKWSYTLLGIAVFLGVTYSFSGVLLSSLGKDSDSIDFIHEVFKKSEPQVAEANGRFDKQYVSDMGESAISSVGVKALDVELGAEERVISEPAMMVKVPELEVSVVIDAPDRKGKSGQIVFDVEANDLAKVSVAGKTAVFLKEELKGVTTSDANVVFESPLTKPRLLTIQEKIPSDQSVVKTIKGDLDSLFN